MPAPFMIAATMELTGLIEATTSGAAAAMPGASRSMGIRLSRGIVFTGKAVSNLYTPKQGRFLV
ncbi:hypothetical protein RvVAR031_19360 [Agrobacterium vitis]|nr:hypothetical protein RvVAR031_19360 [Agrobacterium vitis]